MVDAEAFPRSRTTDIFKVAEGVVGVRNVILDPFHYIEVKLELDASNPLAISILRAEALMPRVPYLICRQPLERMGQLVGLRVERGLRDKVVELVGGSRGCVHLADLTMDGIKLAIQAVVVVWARERPPEEAKEMERKVLGGICIAYPIAASPGEGPHPPKPTPQTRSGVWRQPEYRDES